MQNLETHLKSGMKPDVTKLQMLFSEIVMLYIASMKATSQVEY